jgi:LPXTG-motif cell wall-anchored protein
MYSSNQSPRFSSRRFGAFLVSGALVASFAGLAWMSPASAAHGEADEIAGNPTCAEAERVGEGDEATWLEFKIEAGKLGDGGEDGHDDPDSDLVIRITNLTDDTFDWTSNLDLVAVVVKASNSGLLYDYPETNNLTDAGLHGPARTGLDVTGYHDISHVSFCYVVVATPETPEETPEETPVVVQPAVTPAPEVVAAQPAATVNGETIVLGETLVAGDTLPRTGSAATPMLVLVGGLGIVLGLAMLMAASRKTAISRS